MKLKLLKCGICDHWHNPSAHSNHCPACGSIQVTRTMFITFDELKGKAKEVGRSAPRTFESIISVK